MRSEKRGEVPSRGWPVTTFFSNREPDKYLYYTKEWSRRCVWTCGETSLGFVTDHTQQPHMSVTALIGSGLKAQCWLTRERPL